MKRTNAIAIFALATWIATPPAPAQEIAVRATVPFRFDVGGEVLPDGGYTFSSPLSHILLIKRGAKATTAVFNDSFACDSNRPSAGRGWLVFTRRGDQYFLKAVESSGASIHARLPQFQVPHPERPAKQFDRATRGKDAQVSGSTVLVALK